MAELSPRQEAILCIIVDISEPKGEIIWRGKHFKCHIKESQRVFKTCGGGGGGVGGGGARGGGGGGGAGQYMLLYLLTRAKQILTKSAAL